MRKIIILLFIFITNISLINAQKYNYIKGWSKEANTKIEKFLNSVKNYKDRKVAVFDCDGTVFGQVPYYLADEALYMYADDNYKGKTDEKSQQKLAILDRMVKNGDNVGKPYIEDRVHFLALEWFRVARRLGSRTPSKFQRVRLWINGTWNPVH